MKVFKIGFWCAWFGFSYFLFQCNCYFAFIPFWQDSNPRSPGYNSSVFTTKIFLLDFHRKVNFFNSDYYLFRSGAGIPSFWVSCFRCWSTPRPTSHPTCSSSTSWVCRPRRPGPARWPEKWWLFTRKARPSKKSLKMSSFSNRSCRYCGLSF